MHVSPGSVHSVYMAGQEVEVFQEQSIITSRVPGFTHWEEEGVLKKMLTNGNAT